MARKGNDSLTAQAKGYCGSSLELSLSLSRSPNVTGVRDAKAGSSSLSGCGSKVISARFKGH